MLKLAFFDMTRSIGLPRSPRRSSMLMAARTRTSQFGCSRIFPSLCLTGVVAVRLPSRVAAACSSPSFKTSSTTAARWTSRFVICSVKAGIFTHRFQMSRLTLNCFWMSTAFRPFDSSIAQTTWTLVSP